MGNKIFIILTMAWLNEMLLLKWRQLLSSH